jgi:uncharacterized repeat protein (TIGR03803 family)
MGLWTTVAATAIATLLIVAATPAHAQTFTVIHSFSGSDGGNPAAGLTLDRAGNLYGTTTDGGNDRCQYGCGTVFKLAHAGSGWVLNELNSAALMAYIRKPELSLARTEPSTAPPKTEA